MNSFYFLSFFAYNVCMRMTTKIRLLLVLSAILVTAFVSVSYFNFVTTRNAVRDEILSSSLPLLRENIYSEIVKRLVPPINISSLMANDSFLINWAAGGERDAGQVLQYLRGIRDKYDYFSVFFVSAQNGNYYYYDGILKTMSPDDDHDVWFYDFIGSGREYDLDVDTNEAADNLLTIFINFRIEDYSGRLLGVTGVGLQMESFSRFLADKQLLYARTIYLTDHAGIIQAHSKIELIESRSIHEQRGIGTIADRLLVETPNPVNEYYTGDAGRVLVTSLYIPEIEWFLIVEQPEGVYIRAAQFTLWRTIILGLLASTAIIIISALTVNRYQRRLEHLAVTDELTGAVNRREFDSHFRRAAYRHERYEVPVSIIMLDIDHFKLINDGLGHPVGDKVLVSLVGIIRKSIRPDDLLVRFGGDEFAVLLECELEIAERTAERIRMAVQGEDMGPLLGNRGTVTISAGITGLIKNDTPESLTIRADKALYHAKNQGRNRTATLMG